MNDDREIIAHWERLCAAADDPAITHEEHERRIAAIKPFARTPGYLTVICDGLAPDLPTGQPPGTPEREALLEKAIEKAIEARNRRASG
jgi:hypothetical protein